jgi:amino acid adenylation domain-containing protein
MTPEQSGVWFTEELGGAGTAYHLPLTVELSGKLDVGALRAACAAVLRRHPVLLAAVEVLDGVPYLVPAEEPRLAETVPAEEPQLGETDGVPYLVPAEEPELDEIDFSGLPADERERVVGRCVEAELVRPFVLEKGPLSRFTLVRIEADRHLLVVVAHHLVFDGTSKDILVAEIAAGYRAALDGARPDLPPLPEFAAPPTDPSTKAAARDHWAARWRVPRPVILPGLVAEGECDAGDVTEGECDAGDAEFVDAGFDAELVAAVRQTGARLGVTTFEVLLAGLRAVLWRYGNDPVTVAVDLGTRCETTRHRIGMYVNQFPLTAEVDATLTFADLALATRAALRELYPVRGVPVSRAVAGVPAGLALAPVSVSYRRRAEEPDWPAPLTARTDWSRFNHAARNTLHLHIVDGPDGITAQLRFRPTTLRRDGALRIAGHLRTLLLAAAADPTRPVAELSLLTEDERGRVLADGNGATVDYPDDTTLDQLLAAQVRRTPDAPAVESDEARLTYAQLNSRANRLAHLLRAEGVRPGVVVGVFARRGADLVAGLLAVLKAGGPYLPLDPDLPNERLAFMLADAGVEIVLTASLLAPRLAAVPDVRPILLEQPPPGQPDTDPEPLAGPLDPAYLIYTSGSTGTPKGVLNSHRGMCNRLDWMSRVFPLGAEDAVLQKTPIGFDVSVWELFLPLLTGARLVMARPGGHRDPHYLRAVIERHRVTTVHFVPSMLAVFLDEPGVEACTTLRRTICSGEELSQKLAATFLRRLPGELHNLYGPTEAAIDVTAWHCAADAVAAASRLPIGRPIQNIRVYVVDRADNPVPAGVPGELLIGGPGVALGYLNRPELTAERFVPDPFGPPGSRLYRTGDLARWREDGTLDFLGRIDRQVKLRGNRIEPGEIEAAILAHPAVARSAVLVAGAGEDRRLVAHVVPEPDTPAPQDLPGLLRAHLAARLPDYLVPSGFTVLERLPVTANGKLDNAALAALPVTTRAETSPAAPGSADDLAAAVGTICAQVLGIELIGLDDDLFDLGAHSLTITQIAVRLRRRLGVDLPLQIFYDTPTVSAIVAAAGETSR